MYRTWYALALTGSLLLAGCGGGGGNLDKTAPTIEITDPAEGSTVVAPFVVSGRVSDPSGVREVQCVSEGVTTPATLGSNNQFTCTVNPAVGTRTVTVRATDTAGNQGSVQVTVNVTSGSTTETYTLQGSVSIARAGAAVAGATVAVEGTTITTTTDDAGRFTLEVPVDKRVLTITKEGYASTRVENVTNTGEALEEILQRSFDPQLPSTPPTVTTTLQDGTSVAGDLKFKFTTQTARPEVNGPLSAIVSIDRAYGNSGYLGAGSVRKIVQPTGDDEVTFAAQELAGYTGDVRVHIQVYDFNGNRTHLIRTVKLSDVAGKTVGAPQEVTATAITFGSTGVFGALSVSPKVASELKAFARGGGLNALRASGVFSQAAAGSKDVLQPQAAPSGTVLWTDVAFSYSGETPTRFELWRSFDGMNFERVRSAAPGSIVVNAAEGEYVFRDTSSRLRPGVETHYKVRAVGSNTADSEVDSVTPLDRYQVTPLTPADRAVDVSVDPVFRWSVQGASDHQLAYVLVFDRVQAEGSSIQWIGKATDTNVLKYNADGSAGAGRETLQPYHAYDWQLAALTYNEQEDAFSIGADQYMLFADKTGVAQPVEDVISHEFVTGGN
ncbi:uncharacterized protein YdeI (BOF family) [Deinobacterium chartae]|uniref:Uncharacterized protein YdeI (BOF family) n=1 Tax=Deinobacterium chartae TaxID=521158 RepID=A0A841I3E2_9DEIO|nr:carboxypeptidase-like regulatory domain-containing protein [Deinobacterium chartae]MBB6098940.1 uncharacterized protein YdeI (BOF family) [Deinobacterium chartae]